MTVLGWNSLVYWSISDGTREGSSDVLGVVGEGLGKRRVDGVTNNRTRGLVRRRNDLGFDPRTQGHSGRGREERRSGEG